MGRRFHFYAFSADRWRAPVGNAPPEVIARFDEIAMRYASSNPSEEARSWRARGAAILSGREQVIGEGAEDHFHMWLARTLVSVDQQPEPAPDAELFWSPLSQAFCFRDAEMEGQLLAPGPAGRIGRYLHGGRALFGDELLGGYDLYGWLSGEDDVPLFAGIVASEAWAAYVAPHRYKAAAVPAFMSAWEEARKWVDACAEAERDIFFSSFPLTLTA